MRKRLVYEEMVKTNKAQLQRKVQLRHIAIIMDGNRRWAQLQQLPVFAGHQEGEKRIRPLVDRAIELRIKHLTFWAFSSENWARKEGEIKYLLNLFRRVLKRRVQEFHKRRVRLKIIGDMSRFPVDIQRRTEAWMEKTKDNQKITVNMALSYGGRDEIVRAMQKMIHDSRFTIREEITEKKFAQFLDTAGQPDPELIIRTGGRSRLSGFLAWQSVYSELYFTETLWPDFTPQEFDKAIEWFQEQKRNFGT